MKVVTLSDTHSRHGWIYQLSEGESLDNIETVYHIQGTINASGGVFLPCDIDLLIHAGDMSMMGTETEIEQFLKWYSSIRAKYKVLIAGNHDFLFEKQRMIAKDLLAKYPDIIYLETEEVVIEGIKIYGEPRQPWFHSWAFNVERGEAIKRYWDAIPEDVNILVTHGPPKGILDMTMSGENVGCEDLLYRLPYLEQLKLVVFGHIHEHAGCELINGVYYVNASALNVRYQLQNRPQAFIIDKDKNIRKIELMEKESIEIVEEKKFPPIKSQITYEDYQKLDIRICAVLSAEKIEGKDKLYKLEIDTGIDKRIVVSGIAHQIATSQLIGYSFPFVLNLPPRKIAGIESNAMIVLAEGSDERMFLPGEPGTEIGSIVIK